MLEHYQRVMKFLAEHDNATVEVKKIHGDITATLTLPPTLWESYEVTIRYNSKWNAIHTIDATFDLCIRNLSHMIESHESENRISKV